jgi:hypothetical protein
MFRDFNLSLPDTTISTLKMMAWVVNYWVILLPGLVLIISCQASLLGVLYARGWRSLGRTLRLLNFALLCLLIGFLFFGIGMPLLKLLRGLAGMRP